MAYGPGQPSFFFTIFKKLQALGHVQENAYMGQRPIPSQGTLDAGSFFNFQLYYPQGNNGIFTANPSPLNANSATYLWNALSNTWLIVANQPPISNFQMPLLPPSGPPWPPKTPANNTYAGNPLWPNGTYTAWANFQSNPPNPTNAAVPPSLVGNGTAADPGVFGTWLANAQNPAAANQPSWYDDTPVDAIATIPLSPLCPVTCVPSYTIQQLQITQEPSVFVCSLIGDNGQRPFAGMVDYWVTSQIFLTDQSNGATVFGSTTIPPTINRLTPPNEYNLVAVIGNNSTLDQGNYLDDTANPNPAEIQVEAVAMPWNTVFGPGFSLPALSNFDPTDPNTLYEQYFLNAGTYDIVGIRLNVQNVFAGLVTAIGQAVQAGTFVLPAGVTAEQWVAGGHLCVKVLISLVGTLAFPALSDSPVTNPQIAQKNLAPWDLALATGSENLPDIGWWNFIVGQPFDFMQFDEQEAGLNRLVIRAELLPSNVFQLYVAITEPVWDRLFGDGKGGGSIEGFTRLSAAELASSPLGKSAKPWSDAVVLRWEGGENAIELPRLPNQHYLGMALGVEYDARKLKPGKVGCVSIVHSCRAPSRATSSGSSKLEDLVAGGFTINVGAK